MRILKNAILILLLLTMVNIFQDQCRRKKFLGKSKSAKKNKDDNKQRRSNGNKPKASGDNIIVDFGEAKENKKNYNGIKPKVKSSKKQKKRKPLPHKNKKKNNYKNNYKW